MVLPYEYIAQDVPKVAKVEQEKLPLQFPRKKEIFKDYTKEF